MIEGRALAKTYRAGDRETLALRGVDVRVEAGECVAVMGPSGCGKSTLLDLLGGLDRPTAGEVLLDAQRVDGFGEADWARLRRRRIGFVFQAFHLLDGLTARDNVAIAARVAGDDRRRARARADDLLAALALEGRAEAVPAQLSGGEQQRVAIARASSSATPAARSDRHEQRELPRVRRREALCRPVVGDVGEPEGKEAQGHADDGGPATIAAVALASAPAAVIAARVRPADGLREPRE